MKTRLTIALLAAGMALGQDKPAEPKKSFEATIIPVKTLTGDAFDRLVRLLSVFQERIAADSQLRTIIVYAPKDVTAQIQQVIARLDQTGSEAAIGHNVEMTLTFLRCSTKPATENQFPAEIQPVVRQLRATTQYKDIQLWEVVPLHLQEGKETDETLRLPSPVPGMDNQTLATIQLRPEAVGTKASGRYVRFAKMVIDFRVQTGSSWQDISLNTAGDFIEGQKTVLGKVSGFGDESAVFAVIALKVLD